MILMECQVTDVILCDIYTRRILNRWLQDSGAGFQRCRGQLESPADMEEWCNGRVCHKYTEGGLREQNSSMRSWGLGARVRASGGVQGQSPCGCPGEKPQEATAILDNKNAEDALHKVLFYFGFCEIQCQWLREELLYLVIDDYNRLFEAMGNVSFNDETVCAKLWQAKVLQEVTRNLKQYLKQGSERLSVENIVGTVLETFNCSLLFFFSFKCSIVHYIKNILLSHFLFLLYCSFFHVSFLSVVWEKSPSTFVLVWKIR